MHCAYSHFLCGIGSITLLFFLLKKIANEQVALLGLIFIVFGKFLLYFSHEAKQYNLDLIIYLASFYLFLFKDLNKYSNTKLFGLGLLGAVFIWFSHISVLFLFSIGLYLILKSVFQRDRSSLIRMLIPTLLWAASFLLNYFFFLKNHASNSIQVSAFSSIGYFPPASFTLGDFSWFYDKIIHLIQYPLGTMSGVFIFIVMIFGIVQVITTRNYKILVLLLPVLLHLALSFLKTYPFHGRFILYTTVPIIMLTVLGFNLLIQWRKKTGFIISLVAVLFFMGMPIKSSLKPFHFEEVRPVIEYLNDNMQKEDAIYVYLGAIPSFDFYRNKYTIHQTKIEGKVYGMNPERYYQEVLRIQQAEVRRVWLLFSHYRKEESDYMINQLSAKAELKDSHSENGAAAYLFEYE
jgi:uncharacterized membrane protein